jgi:outer membrane lipoprotein carrier protein
MESVRSTLRGTGFVAALLLSCVLFVSAQTADAHKIAETVDRHYNRLNTLECQFTEIFRGGGMSRTEEGVMYLKKPGKMRWDYEIPQKKLFVTDGKTAWFYVPGERQARRTEVKNLDDFRSPLRYLLGKTKLEKEFNGLSVVTAEQPSQPGGMILRGVPKGMEDRVQESRLEVTPDGRIVRISIEELDGTYTEFRFRECKENVPIADGKFRFAPPAGVEVMQSTELEP